MLILEPYYVLKKSPTAAAESSPSGGSNRTAGGYGKRNESSLIESARRALKDI